MSKLRIVYENPTQVGYYETEDEDGNISTQYWNGSYWACNYKIIAWVKDPEENKFIKIQTIVVTP